MTISENKTDGRMLSFLELLVAAKNESMVFVQGGGRGQTPNPNLNFGSIGLSGAVQTVSDSRRPLF